ncbi:MAG: hypothetical protein AB8G11_24525 [Saprospiraceae bacterium]
MKNIHFLKKVNKSIGIALCILLVLFTSNNSFGQNDINIRNFMNSQADLDALNAAFDNVIGVTSNPNGSAVTYNGINDFQFATSRSSIPNNVSAYTGVDMVLISEGPNLTLSQAQVDALVDFVFQGGILVANFEETTITNPRNGINPAYVGAYLANTFICSDVYVMHTFGDGDNNQGLGESQTCVNPFPYHPGSGNLNLTAPGWDNAISSGGTTLRQNQSSWYVGVPAENAVLYCDADPDDVVGSSGTNAACNNAAVLDMVFPAYPGTPNACGIQGMAFISGESNNGILQNNDRANLQYNRNWAQLAYDFMHDPAAMAVRNAWANTPANVNTTCPAVGAPGTPGGVAVGTIDCSKTQIATAPVAGVPGQKTLMVTMDVTSIGCFSPITVSGSGMSVANGITEVCTETTGIQTFYIPVNYDGSALGTMNFSIGTGNNCTADLTNAPKQVITPIYTLDCVPTVGPSLN